MKKVIVSAAICVFGLDTANGMLVPYNRDNGAIVRRDVAESNIAQNANDAVACVNFREIQPTPLPLQNKVSVLISEYCCADGKSVQVSDSFVRHYPLQREMLGYWHNFEVGKSYPTQKLSVQIDDIEFANQSGNIVLDDEYIDAEHALPHKRRCINRYEMDDANLQAKQFSEIFISTESGDQVIDEAKVREEDQPILYTKIGTIEEKNIGEPEVRKEDNEFNYQKVEIFEEWTRPDGTQFVKRTEDWKRVAKPKPPAPVVAHAPGVVNQAPPPRRRGGFFRRAFGW